MKDISNNEVKIQKSPRKSNVRSTSIESFVDNNASGKNLKNKDKVLDLLPTIQPATRGMIADKLKIASSTLGFPIGKLRDERVIMEIGKDVCKISGKSAFYLVMNNEEGRRLKELFEEQHIKSDCVSKTLLTEKTEAA